MHKYTCATLFTVARTFSSFLFFVSLLLLFLPTTVHAVEPEQVSKQQAGKQIEDTSAVLSVLSVEPSTGQVTTLEASGTWRNGCVPELDTVELTSSEIGNGHLLIAATADPADIACGQSETAWSFPIDVQFDLPGTYTVQLSIMSEQLDSEGLYASKEVLVDGHLGVTGQAFRSAQPVMLTVTGIHGDDCIPEYVSHKIADDTIVVEIMTPDSLEIICGQSISPWQIDVDMADLDDGEYVVEVYRANQSAGVVTDRALYKTDTISVGVHATQAVENFIYLPSVIQGN